MKWFSKGCQKQILAFELTTVLLLTQQVTNIQTKDYKKDHIFIKTPTNISQYKVIFSYFQLSIFFLHGSNKHIFIENVNCNLKYIFINCCGTVLYVLCNTVYIWNVWLDRMQYK